MSINRNMKDSGVKWIGEIPENWDVKPLKQIFIERKEKNDPVQTEEILSLSIDRGIFPYSEKTGGGNKAKDDITAYKLAYQNDIVLNSMNIIVGAVGLSKYFGCVSPVYYTLYTRSNKYDINYYSNIFQSSSFQKNLMGYGNGIMMKESDNGKLNTIRMRIPMEKLNTVEMPIPSTLIEQQKIATYLDLKVGEIDNIILRTKQTIEEYKKYKQSTITEAVTKGLNSEIEMKDSGIDWINKIPKNWIEAKLKGHFNFTKGLSITKDNLVESGVPVISYGQIHSKDNKSVGINQSLIRYVPKTYLEFDKKALVSYNDFIFADTSEDLEGTGNNVRVDSKDEIFAGYHSIIISPIEKIDTKYFAYLFLTDCWRSQLRSRVSGIKLFSITQKLLKQTTIIIPSPKEQQQIADYLDTKCSEIDTLISNKEKIISELEVYKKSLIYEYVTGKKVVPCEFTQGISSEVKVANEKGV